VLVIGGAGYIGSALLPKLLDEGYRVRVLDLFLYGTGPIAAVLNRPELDIVRADFRRVDALVAAMQGVDHLVHLGGIVGDPACAIDEDLTIDVNVAATRLIGEVAKGNGIKHFIFASTCSVYGAGDEILTESSTLNPLSLYARSKAASERLLFKMADDRFTPIVVRFGTIYGLAGRTRFDLVVNLLAAKAVFDGCITVFGGDQWRPFVHVDDAALAVAQLLCLPPGRGADIFNVGSNTENYTIGQVGEIVKRTVPEAELIFESAGQDPRNYRIGFTKIQGMIGFKPRWTVEDGVREVVAAIRAGAISDYREVHYSNERYLTEINGNGLDRPQVQWAYDLLRQSPPPQPVQTIS
jgi:nucleoside-diphosphate-sugar epimerase